MTPRSVQLVYLTNSQYEAHLTPPPFPSLLEAFKISEQMCISLREDQENNLVMNQPGRNQKLTCGGAESLFQIRQTDMHISIHLVSNIQKLILSGFLH